MSSIILEIHIQVLIILYEQYIWLDNKCLHIVGHNKYFRNFKWIFFEAK